jgi:glycosyltransferase involved in cell wall biosynthesis
VIPAVAARYGGPSRSIFEMCVALQQERVELLIATTDADGRGRLPVELGRPIKYQGLDVIFFPRQLSEAFKYSRPFARWLDSNVEKFDLVEIHAVFSHSSLAAARSCRMRRVPYLLRPLGSLGSWSLRHKSLRKRAIWHCGVQAMIQGAAAIHYTTVEEQRQAEHVAPTVRGVVIPLGIDESSMDLSQVPDAGQHLRMLGPHPYVLVLSRLHPVKGLELLLDAFIELSLDEQFQRWKLVIAGDGDARYVESLKRAVRNRNATDRVIFTGWLDGPEKIAVLRSAALFALPSHHENFGVSIVESLACGVPVLISNHVGLCEEIVAAHAGWVSTLDRANLLNSLADALSNEAERKARGIAGRELVRSRFRWSMVAKQLVEFYGSFTDKSSLVEV